MLQALDEVVQLPAGFFFSDKMTSLEFWDMHFVVFNYVCARKLWDLTLRGLGTLREHLAGLKGCWKLVSISMCPTWNHRTCKVNLECEDGGDEGRVTKMDEVKPWTLSTPMGARETSNYPHTPNISPLIC